MNYSISCYTFGFYGTCIIKVSCSGTGIVNPFNLCTIENEMNDMSMLNMLYDDM